MASVNWRCKNCGHDYTVNQISYPPIPQHLLTTNDPPSDTELDSLNDIIPIAIADIGQELVTLNDDIESLQKTLQALQARRTEVEARLLECRSVVSPIRYVPPEILKEIISEATIGEPVPLDNKKGIWSYSRVSRMWRSVTVSTPVFWSTIHVHAPTSLNSFNRVVECLRTILSRTKECPLSLDFYHYDLLEPRYDWALKLLESLVLHAPQWRRVSLTMPDTAHFVHVLNSMKDRVTCLEELSLILREDEYHVFGVNRQSVACFRNAPALRRVSFNDRPTLQNLDMQYIDFIPWSQITEYKADSAFETDCLLSLKSLPNLTYLQLHAQRVHPYHPIPDNVELQKLYWLDVSGSRGIIRRLTLPALQQLTIPLASDEFSPIMNLIRRSECCIITLILDGSRGPLNTNALVIFLKSLPSVSTLDLSSQSPENITILCNILIQSTRENATLLPALTELILPGKQIHDFVDPLVSFLQQRGDSSSAVPVKSVVFTGPYQPLPPELLPLQCDELHISFN